MVCVQQKVDDDGFTEVSDKRRGSNRNRYNQRGTTPGSYRNNNRDRGTTSNNRSVTMVIG